MLHLERADGKGGDAQLGLVADEAGSKCFDEQLLMEPQGREGVWSKGCGSHGDTNAKGTIPHCTWDCLDN